MREERMVWSKLVGIAAIAMLLCVHLSASALAQADRERPQNSKPKAAKPEKAAPGMTKAREAAAMAFVREHHPELEALLIQLGESNPKQYQAALRDLFRTSERLAQLHEKDSDRYEAELNAWKVNSRVQLLSATLLMTPGDNKLRAKLKQAMLDHAKMRRELLLLERDRVRKRLDRIELQIERIDEKADQMVDRQIETLLQDRRKAEGKDRKGKTEDQRPKSAD